MSFETLLRDKGLRVTNQRRTILEALAGTQEPLSHTELADQLEGDLDRATVFRNLVNLAEKGVLLRVDLGDQVWRYQLADAADHTVHPHLVCDDCGGVECLEEDEVMVKKETMRARVSAVQLRGTCDDCT